MLWENVDRIYETYNYVGIFQREQNSTNVRIFLAESVIEILVINVLYTYYLATLYGGFEFTNWQHWHEL